MASSLTIQELPLEMIIEIFSYLNLSDLKEASLVCNLWYDALYHRKTLDRMILTLNTANYEKYKTIMKKRSFYNIKFYEIDFHKNHNDIKLWQEMGHSLQMLMFRDCTFTINELVSILQTTQNLNQLNIEICNFVDPVENVSVANCLGNTLRKVTKFKFELLDEDNIELFNILIGMMPNLKNLEIDRFNNEINDRILKILELKASTLKGFCIYNYSPPELIENIAKIKSLKLEEFNFNTSSSVALSKCIYTNQQTLTKLFLIESANCNLKSICNHMINLETLYIKFAYDIRDDDIADLWKLKKLKFLQLNQSSITAKGLIDGLKEKNDNLQSLTLRFSNSGENLVMHISEKFHNLRELEIRCQSGITESDLQRVWKNLHFLKVFNLMCYENNSLKVTDFALTGKQLNNESEGYSIANLKGLQQLQLTCESQITVASLREIGKLNELISLTANFSKSKLQLDDVKILNNCGSLEKLVIVIPGKEPSKTRKKAIKKYFRRIKTFTINEGYKVYF